MVGVLMVVIFIISNVIVSSIRGLFMKIIGATVMPFKISTQLIISGGLTLMAMELLGLL
ncbi:hypothetical protein [Filifactor villosus]|uniref:Uncharacterized protein n=1 Tax=Filifactor villosus TaxID=29374 RepID=A0ABV9QLB5_9FIRM